MVVLRHPETIKTKMAYARSKALGGAFAWELSGDTADGVLLKAMRRRRAR